jgi:hypothetical protein
VARSIMKRPASSIAWIEDPAATLRGLSAPNARDPDAPGSSRRATTAEPGRSSRGSGFRSTPGSRTTPPRVQLDDGRTAPRPSPGIHALFRNHNW